MGGVVYAATLRGAFRIAEGKARLLEGAGAAFSLAATGSGLAVGYGQGVLLPGPRLISAFHGLPGNQAYALAASGEALWVGTPTGLGRVERRRVTERVLPGEGKLPHPWVTALWTREDGLWVATYGGGLAVRRAGDEGTAWESFPETRGGPPEGIKRRAPSQATRDVASAPRVTGARRVASRGPRAAPAAVATQISSPRTATLSTHGSGVATRRGAEPPRETSRSPCSPPEAISR